MSKGLLLICLLAVCSMPLKERISCWSIDFQFRRHTPWIALAAEPKVPSFIEGINEVDKSVEIQFATLMHDCRMVGADEFVLRFVGDLTGNTRRYKWGCDSRKWQVGIGRLFWHS